jgi:RNA polymerase sigma factor (sigma-70 family)
MEENPGTSRCTPQVMPDSSDTVRRELVALLPRLRRFGRTLAQRREDADDLVQIAVERALNRADQWQPGTRLDSWVFRIMQNAWIDETRARARRGLTFVPEEEGEHVGVSTTDAQIDAIAVRKAVAQLNDDQRAVVGLVLIEGLPYKEAAEVLGLPIGTLTSRLARARETLQAVLSDAKGER